jgi:hypothetical protein
MNNEISDLNNYELDSVSGGMPGLEGASGSTNASSGGGGKGGGGPIKDPGLVAAEMGAWLISTGLFIWANSGPSLK